MLTHPLRVLAALGLMAASGCWLQTGLDAGRSGTNGSETTITSATVGDLAVAWSVPADLPRETLVNGGTAYLPSRGDVRALDVATGAVRWTRDLGGAAAGAALAGSRLWVPTSGSNCVLYALDPGTGATVGGSEVAGPDLGAGSGCLATDALAYGTKVGTSWAYAGQSGSIRGFPCFPEDVWQTGSGVHVEDFDVPANGFDSGGYIGGCGDLPSFPPDPTTLSSDGTVVYELS